MRFNCPLVLASGSPRRKKLLEQLGLSFEVHVSDADESFDPDDTPADIVRQLAEIKANAISASFPDALVLAADTIVVSDGEVLGKPVDAQAATETLRKLSGNTHQVFTGIALHHLVSDRRIQAFEETNVTFARLSDAEIAGYVATGSPMDKAGAYGIQDDQGALYIPRIEGDYYNVVGLPLHRLYTTLRLHFDDLISR